MAVAGIGVERHVADDAEIRHLRLDRTHGPADEVGRVQAFRGLLVAQRDIRIGEERDRRQAECCGFQGSLDGKVDRQPLDAGHARDWGAHPSAFDQEDRPDQVVDAK